MTSTEPEFIEPATTEALAPAEPTEAYAGEAAAAEPEFIELYVNPEDAPETARKLLDAAGDLPERVLTVTGGFRVPRDVAEKAGVSASHDDAVDATKVEGGQVLDGAAAPQREDAAAAIHDAPAGLPGGDREPVAEARPTPGVTADLTGDGEDDGDPSALNGAALDAALREAGLSTSGRVAEKQARLAEHQAQQP